MWMRICACDICQRSCGKASLCIMKLTFSFWRSFLHLQCCPFVLYPSEICKCAALLSAIPCLFIACCHCNGTSFVNHTLCAARLLYAKLNPCAIVSDWMCQNPVWTGLFCTVKHPECKSFVFLFCFVCHIFNPSMISVCPSQSNTHNSLLGKDALIVINILVLIYFASWHGS